MAIIVADAGGGNWTTGATWVGGVAPTAADDAQLVLASGAVTIDAGAVCRSLDCNTYTGTLTHSAAVTLTIGDATAGNGNIALRLVAGMTYTLGNSVTSAITFISTSATVQTVDYAGKVPGNMTFNAASNGSWQLTGTIATPDSFQIMTLTKGTLDINGQTVACGRFISTGSATRTLTMGASQFTCVGTSGGAAWSVTATGMTFNANTSTIITTSINTTFLGSTLTYNNITTTAGAGAGITGAFTVNGTLILNSPDLTITFGGQTINNLTLTGAALKTQAFSVNATTIVSGTFTITGNSVTNRIFLRSLTLGTAAIFTITGATVVASNCDFRDITFSVATDLSTITGGSGDCGGNSGITFTTSATQTSTGTASFTWSTHGWTTRVPLPQDDVVINNAFIATRVVTLDMPRAGRSINWTGATGTPAWAKTTATTVYGSVTMIAAMTNTGTTTFTMEGRGSFTWTSAGQTFTNPLIVAMFGGTLTMQDAFLSSSSITLNNGTLSSTFNVTAVSFTSNSGLTRTLTMDAATWTFNSTTIPWTLTTTGLTLNAQTSTIVPSATTGTTVFDGGGATYNNLSIPTRASGTLDITGSNTFNMISITAPASVRFTAGTTTTVTNFNATGSAGNIITLGSITAASHTLSKASGTVSGDYLNISRSTAGGGAAWYAGANSTDSGNNSGWIFTAPPAAGGRSGNLLLLGVGS